MILQDYETILYYYYNMTLRSKSTTTIRCYQATADRKGNNTTTILNFHTTNHVNMKQRHHYGTALGISDFTKLRRDDSNRQRSCEPKDI